MFGLSGDEKKARSKPGFKRIQETGGFERIQGDNWRVLCLQNRCRNYQGIP